MKYWLKPFSIIVIFCLGIIVYSNTFLSSFHFDDRAYIIDNAAIKNLFNLQNIWGYYPCRFFTFLSIALNYHFFGLNVLSYHIFNLAIHIISAILVWWLTLLTLSTPVLKKNKIAQDADLIALFAGLIFVVHPIQTEAVTFIWQRAASMATMFYLVSLCFYVNARLLQIKEPNSAFAQYQYLFSLLIAVVAMFTKEMTFTLPLMIVLYESCFLKTEKENNWRTFLPFLIMLVIIPSTILLSGSPQEKLPPDHISPIHYFLTELRVMATYLRLIFFPFNQNADYDYPIFNSILELPVLFSSFLIISILVEARFLYSKYRIVSFSIFWFFLTLLPESSFLAFKDVIWEHRLYLPMVGYSMFLVTSVYYLWGKNSLKIMVVILSLIVVGYSFMTYQRNKIWKDEITLWNDTLSKSPHKGRPNINLGFYYEEQGNLDKSLEYLNKGIAIDPNSADSYAARGDIYEIRGNFNKALVEYTKAIMINPDSWVSYSKRGILLEKQGDFSRSIIDFTHSLELNPNNAQAHLNLAYIYGKQENPIKVIFETNKVLEIEPDNAEAHMYLGLALGSQGKLNRAIDEFNIALEIDPNYKQAYDNRALAYSMLEKLGEKK